MKNKYLQCALVLSSICVVSAGAIGGLHYLSEIYSAAHQSTDAPASIKALDADCTFEKVTDFTPTKSLGVTINAVYLMKDGSGNKAGYAYEVDGGAPVNNDLTFTIAFKGAVDDSTLSALKPSAIKVTNGGDGDDYTKTAQQYADAIVDGSHSLDESVKVVIGATSKSCSALQNAIGVVKTDYNNRWNGAGPVEDNVPQYIRKMYANAATADLDSTFSALSFSFKDANSATKNGSIGKRYIVTMEDSSVAWVYEGTTSDFSVNSYGDDVGHIDLYVSFEGDVDEAAGNKAVKPAKYAIDTENTSFSRAQWETYLPDIMEGGSIDVEDKVVSNGATITTTMVRSMVRKMRDSYYTDKLAEQKNNVGKIISEMYPTETDYALDAGYVAIVADNLTVNNDGTGSYNIDQRYTVTLPESTARVYASSCTLTSSSIGKSVACTLYVGFSSTDKANIKPDGYKVVGSSMFTQWEESYLGALVKGEEPTISCGSTYSADLCRQIVEAMKTDYATLLG